MPLYKYLNYYKSGLTLIVNEIDIACNFELYFHYQYTVSRVLTLTKKLNIVKYKSDSFNEISYALSVLN